MERERKRRMIESVLGVCGRRVSRDLKGVNERLVKFNLLPEARRFLHYFVFLSLVIVEEVS